MTASLLGPARRDFARSYSSMTAWVIAAATVSSVSRLGWLTQLTVGHAQIVGTPARRMHRNPVGSLTRATAAAPNSATTSSLTPTAPGIGLPSSLADVAVRVPFASTHRQGLLPSCLPDAPDRAPSATSKARSRKGERVDRDGLGLLRVRDIPERVHDAGRQVCRGDLGDRHAEQLGGGADSSHVAFEVRQLSCVATPGDE